jgi:hypothetical protein
MVSACVAVFEGVAVGLIVILPVEVAKNVVLADPAQLRFCREGLMLETLTVVQALGLAPQEAMLRLLVISIIVGLVN